MAVYLSMLLSLPSIIYSCWDACDFVIGPYPMITHAPSQVVISQGWLLGNCRQGCALSCVLSNMPHLATGTV